MAQLRSISSASRPLAWRCCERRACRGGGVRVCGCELARRTRCELGAAVAGGTGASEIACGCGRGGAGRLRALLCRMRSDWLQYQMSKFPLGEIPLRTAPRLQQRQSTPHRRARPRQRAAAVDHTPPAVSSAVAPRSPWLLSSRRGCLRCLALCSSDHHPSRVRERASAREAALLWQTG